MKCQGWRLGSLSVYSFLFLLLSACGQGHSGWESFPIPVYVDASIVNNPASRADLEDGMRFWEQRVGKQLFDIKGTWNGGGQPYSGQVTNPDSIFENIVYIPNSWPFAPGFVGMTVLKPFDSGQMAMVMINPSTSFCNGDCQFDYNRTSLRKTFAHELGHFLGLQHVSDTNNIMYATSRPGGSLNNLSVDDNALRSVTGGE